MFWSGGKISLNNVREPVCRQAGSWHFPKKSAGFPALFLSILLCVQKLKFSFECRNLAFGFFYLLLKLIFQQVSLF